MTINLGGFSLRKPVYKQLGFGGDSFGNSLEKKKQSGRKGGSEDKEEKKNQRRTK